MTARFLRYVALTLAAVLVLTGHSMAIARGMPGVAGYAEYCIAETAVMVPVDAEGNPTGPAHICPDFSASLFTWILEAETLVQAEQTSSRIVGVAFVDHVQAIRRSSVHARDPPAILLTRLL